MGLLDFLIPRPRATFPKKVQILVLSLMDTTPENMRRRAEFRKRANVLGIEFAFFPAVNGKSVNHAKYIENGVLRPSHNLSPGQIGCMLSHQQIWQYTIHSGVDCTVVFEDDAILDPDFKIRFENALREAPYDMDLMYIGHCFETKGGHLSGELYRSSYPRCTHGYMVTKQGAEKLCAWVSAGPSFNMPVDEELARAISQGKLKACSMFPTIVNADDQATSIVNSL